jgi:hypothetical protein
MFIPEQTARKIISFVGNNTGCTKEEIKNGVPCANNSIDEILLSMCEDANPEDGFLLENRNGRYYLGPKSYLLNDDSSK